MTTINIFYGPDDYRSITLESHPNNTYQDIVTDLIKNGINSGPLFRLDETPILNYDTPIAESELDYAPLVMDYNDIIDITDDRQTPHQIPLDDQMIFRDLYNYLIADGVSTPITILYDGQPINLDDSIEPYDLRDNFQLLSFTTHPHPHPVKIQHSRPTPQQPVQQPPIQQPPIQRPPIQQPIQKPVQQPVQPIRQPIQQPVQRSVQQQPVQQPPIQQPKRPSQTISQQPNQQTVVQKPTSKIIPITIFGVPVNESMEINDDVVVSDVINSFLEEYRWPEAHDMGLFVVKDGSIRPAKNDELVTKLDGKLYIAPPFEVLFDMASKNPE